MHVLHWLLTGLVAGLFARVLTGARMSLGAELALGSIGGLATGTLMRYIGITSPGTGGVIHILIALVGAIGTIVAMHVVLRLSNRAGRFIAASIKPAGVESKLATLGERERRVFEKFLSGEIVARDATVEQQEQTTLGQRAADRIAGFGGSWAFMGLFAAILFAWMRYNSEATDPFDPYPFILLNLVLSCIAAAQAPIILMSQNRQSEKDRLHARLDYEVNLKAEVEILALHDKLDELRDREWHKELLDMQRRQIALLEKLEKTKS
ncbi:MAG: putative rane protein [Verrucomicrobiaceae bacterium]|nr:putative rane protein [Verrucomicrobiaceae bacterium]